MSSSMRAARATRTAEPFDGLLGICAAPEDLRVSGRVVVAGWLVAIRQSEVADQARSSGAPQQGVGPVAVPPCTVDTAAAQKASAQPATAGLLADGAIVMHDIKAAEARSWEDLARVVTTRKRRSHPKTTPTAQGGQL